MEYTKGKWEITVHRPLSNLVIAVKHSEHTYDDDAICQLSACPEEKANAERIVKAVNCHDNLVEALRELEPTITSIRDAKTVHPTMKAITIKALRILAEAL